MKASFCLFVLLVPALAHSQPASEGEDDDVERVPLIVESTGESLTVRRLAGVAIGPRGTSEVYLDACRTPCTLSVPPGPVALLTGGPGLLQSRERLLVPKEGIRVSVRSVRAAPHTWGVGLAVFGTLTLFGGAVALAVSTTQWGPRADLMKDLGIGMALTGGLTLIPGIVLLATTASPGVESQRRLAERASR